MATAQTVLVTNQIFSAPPKFDPFKPEPDDWTTFINQYKQWLIANGVSDDKKKSILLTSITPKTFKLLSNLLIPETIDSADYPTIVRTLTAHFQPEPILIAERFRFKQCERSSEESIASYMSELRRLASTCKFEEAKPQGYLEDALRDQFVKGVRNQAIQRRLLSEKDLTLKRTLEIAQSIEAATEKSREMSQVSDAASTPTAEENLLKAKTSPGQYIRNRPAPNYRCNRCGLSGEHFHTDCYMKNKECFNCGKIGHKGSVCRSPRRADVPGPRPDGRSKPFQSSSSASQQHQLDENTQLENSNVSSVNSYPDIYHVSANIASLGTDVITAKYMLDIRMNGKNFQMEFDSGAAFTIVGKLIWEMLGCPPLQPTTIKLVAYGGAPIPCLGKCTVRVSIGNMKNVSQTLYVAEKGASLFGRNWIKTFRSEINVAALVESSVHVINSVSNAALSTEGAKKLNSILEKHKKVFENRLGRCASYKAQIHVKENSQPVFSKARPVPFALRQKVDDDIDRLLSLGVIERIETSDWASPIVTAPKPDGSVRICADFKRTVNPCVDVTRYPLPRAEELFAKLQGGKMFSNYDMRDAYLQIELDEESKKLCVVNTHRGLFRYNRLPFGINSAPAIFQETVEKILTGIGMTGNFIDDICSSGKDEGEHLDIIDLILTALERENLVLKLEKCRFFQRSVEYLGYVLDGYGIHTNPKKVEKVLGMPKPSDRSTLRSFLGAVNRYTRFIPNLADILAPMSRLLRQDSKWDWTAECDASFLECKKILTSPLVLAHYDPKRKLYLACDASPYGIGAVLFHKDDKTSMIHPISFLSKTLTRTESNYGQVDKEGLALVFGVKKFHQYLYGNKFTLMTDHDPLLRIFGENSKIPDIATSRRQRWALFLSAFNYELQFVPGKENAWADCLSRLPVGYDFQFENEVSNEDSFAKIQQQSVEYIPELKTNIVDYISKDSGFKKLCELIQDGWKNVHPKDLPVSWNSFYGRREDLYFSDGCIFLNQRMFIPLPFRQRVLSVVHDGHPGIVAMKSIARQHVWWPGIDKDIEGRVKSCNACQLNRKEPSHLQGSTWPTPEEKWERVHIDYAGPFRNKQWFIAVCAKTKWPEVIEMANLTVHLLIGKLRAMFCRNGIPKAIVSDNGPTFTSEEFQEFCRENGIRHLRSAPYHPSSNGQAERFVQTFKNGVRSSTNIHRDLCELLLRYRNTPHPATGVSPASLFCGQNLRTRLDLLRTVPAGGEESNQIDRVFHKQQKVWYRSYNDKQKWKPGVIVDHNGSYMYSLRTLDGRLERRHIDQLRDRSIPSSSLADPTIDNYPPIRVPHSPNISPNSITPSTSDYSPPTLRPRAQLKKPERLGIM